VPDYIVGTNLADLPSEYRPYARAIYPGGGERTILRIGLGQAHELGTWQIPPPLPIVKITGVATWMDGTRCGRWNDGRGGTLHDRRP
jgi:hypothetical protein